MGRGVSEPDRQASYSKICLKDTIATNGAASTRQKLTNLGLQEPLPVPKSARPRQACGARRPRDAQRLVRLPLRHHQDVGEQEQGQLVALPTELVLRGHLHALNASDKAAE